MMATLAVIQWLVALAILVVAFRHSYRAGRITSFSVVFTWAALTFDMLVFAADADSLSHDDREHWAFPDGQHFLGMLLAGWMNGLLVAIVAVGIRRLIRGERLFQFARGGSGK